MNHLEYLDIPIDKLLLGFNPTVSKYITWNTYLETWRKIDAGETRIRHLPLYKALARFYSELPLKRREYESKLLGIDSVVGGRLAYKWLEIHIELYHSIKQSGFKPELRKHPLSVNITDNGEFKVVDGNHTVSILKHLNHNGKLRFKVNKREDGWLLLKQQLYDMYGKKLLYQPVNHPDFDDWKIDRASEDRFNVIYPSLGDIQNKTILDVGSNMGYFCERLVDKGATVTGIDPNGNRVKASRLFSAYHGYKPTNPQYNVATFESHLENKHYDIVLLLSLIHHYIRRNVSEAFDALGLISRHCDKMVLELGLNNLPIKWNPEHVLKHSDYTKYTTLYDGERPIYLYEK